MKLLPLLLLTAASVSGQPHSRWTAQQTIDQMFHGVFQILLPIVTPSTGPSVAQSFLCTGSFTTNPSTTCTAGVNVTNGNYVVVMQYSGGSSTSWNTPTKSSGTATVGTFTIQQGGGACTIGIASTFAQCLWIAPVTGTGSLVIGVSVNSSSSTYSGGGVQEISGVSGTVDATSTYADSGFCTSCSGSSITPSSGDLILTFLATNSSATSYSAPSPFTFRTNSSDSQTNILGLGSYVTPSSGAYTPTWTNGAGNHVSVVSIAIAHQ